MIDSLKYGIPYGMVAFAWLLIFRWLDWEAYYLFRWLSLHGLALAAVFYSIKQANRAYFPFRFGVLSAFNVVFASTFTIGLTMFVVREPFVQGLPEGMELTKWILFQFFLEGLGHMMSGLLVSFVYAYLFRIKSS
jgi:hypothetical protein